MSKSELAALIRFGANAVVEQEGGGEMTDDELERMLGRISQIEGHEVEDAAAKSSSSSSNVISGEAALLERHQKLKEVDLRQLGNTMYTRKKPRDKDEAGQNMDLILNDKRARKERVVMIDGRGTGYGGDVPVLADSVIEAAPVTISIRRTRTRVWKHQHCCALCGKRASKAGEGTSRCAHCPHVFHAPCMEGAGMTRGAGMFICPHHKCIMCFRTTAASGGMLFRCIGCLTSFCEDCLPEDEIESIGRSRVYEEFGYYSRQAYYIKCPYCAENTQTTERKIGLLAPALLDETVAPHQKLQVGGNTGAEGHNGDTAVIATALAMTETQSAAEASVDAELKALAVDGDAATEIDPEEDDEGDGVNAYPRGPVIVPALEGEEPEEEPEPETQLEEVKEAPSKRKNEGSRKSISKSDGFQRRKRDLLLQEKEQTAEQADIIVEDILEFAESEHVARPRRSSTRTSIRSRRLGTPEQKLETKEDVDENEEQEDEEQQDEDQKGGEEKPEEPRGEEQKDEQQRGEQQEGDEQKGKEQQGEEQKGEEEIVPEGAVHAEGGAEAGDGEAGDLEEALEVSGQTKKHQSKRKPSTTPAHKTPKKRVQDEEVKESSPAMMFLKSSARKRSQPKRLLEELNAAHSQAVHVESGKKKRKIAPVSLENQRPSGSGEQHEGESSSEELDEKDLGDVIANMVRDLPKRLSMEQGLDLLWSIPDAENFYGEEGDEGHVQLKGPAIATDTRRSRYVITMIRSVWCLFYALQACAVPNVSTGQVRCWKISQRRRVRGRRARLFTTLYGPG
jgi:hypothetical protein